MVKKKISGQTIAIIILAALLLLTIAFGGVFAYYSARSNKVSGKIVMANLKISLEAGNGESDKSEIIISKEEHVVPGQPLENYPLIVRNLSTVDIYLIVVYTLNATKEDEDGNEVKVADQYVNPVIEIGSDYCNPSANKTSVYEGNDKQWIDYVFETESGEKYRCLVSTVSFKPTSKDGEGITVIKEDKLMLAKAMNNDYQSTSISFTFQAYAIGAASFTNDEINETTSMENRCQKIVSAIYDYQGQFLKI